METFSRFLYEFLKQFFSGVLTIIKSIGTGITETLNFKAYQTILDTYKNDLTTPEWVLVIISLLCIAIFVGLIIALIYLLCRKYMKFRKKAIDQDELLEEVASLNKQVETLMKEKEKIMAMKVSQLGLKPDEASEVEEGEKSEDESVDNPDIRFSKLNEIDLEYANYRPIDYGNSFSLPDLCNNFRNFAASKLRLYYKPEMVRIFISGLASTKLIILQGISGTGKTSLAYAWGKFMRHDSCVASVQPSWRDRTDIFGYLNEFTKKFNETDFLSYLYTAGYTDEIYTVILDEMNLARVEYYFAEMLSILEMHNTDEWLIEIVQSVWPTDPKKLINGKLHVPPNCWYIGTINNDDSTFMVTDKVYDRAMPIDLNEKGTPFDYDEVDALDVNYSYLNGLFESAKVEYAMSEETSQKIEKMDNYTIKHFRVAFGNRIVKHMRKFVPVYVACGGDETEAVDYFMAKKVLRKFEALNLALIRDEIDGYIEFLDSLFGKGKMKECTEFLLRLKKMG